MTTTDRHTFRVGDIAQVSATPGAGKFILIARAPSVFDRTLCNCGRGFLARWADHRNNCAGKTRKNGAWWLQSLETGQFYRPDGVTDTAVFPAEMVLISKYDGPQDLERAGIMELMAS